MKRSTPSSRRRRALAWLLVMMRSRDEPYNCFPSIHIASSYLLLRSYWACGLIAAPAKWAVDECALTIVASTFFLKQHVFLNGAGAVLLVEMEAEQLGRLFDRFYRVDPSRSSETGGSGLGLAIAKSIVEAHEGRIWAESGSGEILFWVELPLARHYSLSANSV